jgi:thymidine phosphorylase
MLIIIVFYHLLRSAGTLAVQKSQEVFAESDGMVTSINNFQMAKIARMAGAPMMKKASVDLLKKLGDRVKKGGVLYRIHAEFPADFKFAQQLAEHNNGYTLGNEEQVLKSLIAP